MKLDVTAFKQNFYRFGNRVKKASPELLIGSGLVALITAAVMACKATLKAQDVAKEERQHIEEIKKETGPDAKKNLMKAYGRAAVNVGKLYLPSIGVGLLGTAGILSAHHIMHMRLSAMAAAYATLDEGYKSLLKRTEEKFGEKAAHDLKNGIREEETESEENGKKKKIKQEVAEGTGIQGASAYARFFDELSEYWEKDAEANLVFLKKQQSYANQQLRIRGKLFLNDVYKMLGIPITQAGQVVGWVYDPEDKTHDNYVDFGLEDVNRRKTREFVNGYERSILLDFNVDGVIWDKLPK